MLLRPLLFLTFAGLLILPDWSTARPFRRRVSAPPVAACPVAYSYPAASYPVYRGPAMPAACPPAVAYPAGLVVSEPVYVSGPVFAGAVTACPPVTVTPAPKGPTVIPERMPEGKQSTGASPELRGEPIRPVRAEEQTQQPPAPLPIPSVPPRPFGEPIPRAGSELALPKAATEEAQKPAVSPPVPAAPPTAPLPEFPPLGLDKPEPPAKPEPVKPEPAKPKAADALPSFDLPTLPPLAPPQLVPPTEAKSSPLNADPVIDVYPTAGTVAADRTAKRSVGFINKSGRDILLTVEGKLTTLPSGQYLSLDLPAKFVWQMGGEKEREVIVPEGAPGVSVVIRK